MKLPEGLKTEILTPANSKPKPTFLTPAEGLT